MLFDIFVKIKRDLDTVGKEIFGVEKGESVAEPQEGIPNNCPYTSRVYGMFHKRGYNTVRGLAG